MNIVQRFDDWLFDNRWFGFQILSNKFQKLTGLTCFWLAKWFVVAWFCSFLLRDIFTGFLFSPYGVFLNCITSVITITGFLFFENENKEYKSQTNEVLMNSSRLRCQGLRVFFVIVALGILVFVICDPKINNILTSLLFIFCVTFMYFGACTPLPPSKSKVRKWYEKVLVALDKLATPVSAPSHAKL